MFLGPTFPDKIIGLGTTLTLWDRLTLDGLGEFQRGGYNINFVGFQNALRGKWRACYDAQRKLIAAHRGNAAALNDVNALATASAARSTARRNVGCWIEKIDFFRLRYVTVTYAMPARLLPRHAERDAHARRPQPVLQLPTTPGSTRNRRISPDNRSGGASTTSSPRSARSRSRFGLVTATEDHAMTSDARRGAPRRAALRWLAACNVLDVTNPGPIDDKDLNKAVGDAGLVTGMAFDLSRAMDAVTQETAIMADELYHGGSYAARGAVQPRHHALRGRERHVGRHASRALGRRIGDRADEDGARAAAFDSSPLAARANIYAGLANRTAR